MWSDCVHFVFKRLDSLKAQKYRNKLFRFDEAWKQAEIMEERTKADREKEVYDYMYDKQNEDGEDDIHNLGNTFQDYRMMKSAADLPEVLDVKFCLLGREGFYNVGTCLEKIRHRLEKKYKELSPRIDLFFLFEKYGDSRREVLHLGYINGRRQINVTEWERRSAWHISGLPRHAREETDYKLNPGDERDADSPLPTSSQPSAMPYLLIIQTRDGIFFYEADDPDVLQVTVGESDTSVLFNGERVPLFREMSRERLGGA